MIVGSVELSVALRGSWQVIWCFDGADRFGPWGESQAQGAQDSAIATSEKGASALVETGRRTTLFTLMYSSANNHRENTHHGSGNCQHWILNPHTGEYHGNCLGDGSHLERH